MTAIVLPERIVEVARSWIGTPYHHQASLKGVGCDCLGLIRGVWREVYGAEHEQIPPYSMDWAEASKRETLYEGAKRYLLEVDITHALRGKGVERAQVGDIVLFRMKEKGPAKHCGFVATDGKQRTLIHAYSGGYKVREEPLTLAWALRAAYAFRFPDAAAYGEKLSESVPKFNEPRFAAPGEEG